MILGNMLLLSCVTVWFSVLFNEMNFISLVSQLESGRKLILDPKRQALMLLSPYLMHKSEIRRLGVLQTFRNLCFDEDAHSQILETAGLFSLIIAPIGVFCFHLIS